MEIEIVCPACATRNRVATSSLAKAACGHCSTRLAPDAPKPENQFARLAKLIGWWGFGLSLVTNGVVTAVSQATGASDLLDFWDVFKITAPLTVAAFVLIPVVATWKGSGGNLLLVSAAIVVGTGVISQRFGAAAGIDVWAPVTGKNCFDVRMVQEFNACVRSIDAGPSANPVVILWRAARNYWSIYGPAGFIAGILCAFMAAEAVFNWLPRTQGHAAIINMPWVRKES